MDNFLDQITSQIFELAHYEEKQVTKIVYSYNLDTHFRAILPLQDINQQYCEITGKPCIVNIEFQKYEYALIGDDEEILFQGVVYD